MYLYVRMCPCREAVSKHVCLICEARRIMLKLFISNFNVDLLGKVEVDGTCLTGVSAGKLSRHL
jgi:hypothetical protein